MATNVIFVLAALVVFGTTPVPNATSYQWRVVYDGGAFFTYSTPGPRVEFEPSRGEIFYVQVQTSDGFTWSPWSQPSDEMVIDPLEGDANFDGVVNIHDLNLIRRNFGNALP